jgi:alpha-galactosidase
MADFMLGDYYPLTNYTLRLDKWIAWQFDRPEHGDGMIQAFRRDSCDQPMMKFHFNRLNKKAYYKVTNFDVEGSMKISGRELVEQGLTIEIREKPGSAVITYQEVK